MRHFPLRPFAVVAVLLSVAAGRAAFSADDNKGVDTKTGIPLPKDPKAAVITYDPGVGGFIRKGPPPHLLITADGTVTVTDLHSGAKKESKLTAKQLEELVRFVVADNDFLNVTDAKIAEAVKTEAAKGGPFIALGGYGITVISVQTEAKRQETSYRGAGEFAKIYPNAKPLVQFAAVEKRLSELAAAAAKGK